MQSQQPGLARAAPAERTEDEREREQGQRAGDPGLTEAMSAKIDEPQSEGEHEQAAAEDKQCACPGDAEKQHHLAGTVSPPRGAVRDAGDEDPGDEEKSAS